MSLPNDFPKYKLTFMLSAYMADFTCYLLKVRAMRVSAAVFNDSLQKIAKSRVEPRAL
jgi:hypothetical protein